MIDLWPAPDHHHGSVSRWHTPDGAVVADTEATAAGVYVYLADGEQRLVKDPQRLAAALLAAEETIAYRPAMERATTA